MSEAELLASSVSEYTALVGRVSTLENTDMDQLVSRLSSEHDWTERGAQAITSLANEYGVFMLRNALALAIALGKEDGELDF